MLFRSPVPVIASVEGGAAGAGLSLALEIPAVGVSSLEAIDGLVLHADFIVLALYL